MSKYKSWYDQIIERAKERELDCYSEWHHVLPRSLGGNDEDSNLVQLTYREHFLVHWLLTKIYAEGRGRRSMIYALLCMGTMGRSGSQRIIASWQFDVAKRVVKNHFLAVSRVKTKKELQIEREKIERYFQRRQASTEIVKDNLANVTQIIKKKRFSHGKRYFENISIINLDKVQVVSSLDVTNRNDRDALKTAADLYMATIKRKDRHKPIKDGHLKNLVFKPGTRSN